MNKAGKVVMEHLAPHVDHHEGHWDPWLQSDWSIGCTLPTGSDTGEGEQEARGRAAMLFSSLSIPSLLAVARCQYEEGERKGNEKVRLPQLV